MSHQNMHQNTIQSDKKYRCICFNNNLDGYAFGKNVFTNVSVLRIKDLFNIGAGESAGTR
jgi:hypothetical protein